MSGWAECLILSHSDYKGSTLGPGAIAHKDHIFFFLDNRHGAENAAGFGWRNGG
jgi:hypothetical protein